MEFHLPPAIRQSPNGAPDRPALNYAICHQNDIGSKLSGKKVLDGKLASSPLLALQQVDDLLLVVNSARSPEFDEVIGKKIADVLGRHADFRAEKLLLELAKQVACKASAAMV